MNKPPGAIVSGGPGSIGGPGGIPGLGKLPGGSGRPINPAGLGDPDALRKFAQSPGLNGLGALAKSAGIAEKSSTVPVSRQALAEQASRVREHFNHHDCFHGDWWDRHGDAWQAAAWATAATAYAAYGSGYGGSGYGYAGYGSSDGGYSYGSYGYGDGSYASGSSSQQPVYYDYGSNVVYEGNNVYVNGDSVATQEQYAEQAKAIADTGKEARASEEEDWVAIGVFAMVQGEQVNGNHLFQLAVNKAGILRGNFYDALSDTALPIYGSVDKKTQRAAWTIGDRKEPIFEAGFANLKKSETAVLVHFGTERTQQWTLVRIEQPAERK